MSPHRLIGTPYELGGRSPEAGFDCWALVEYARRECFGLPTPIAADIAEVSAIAATRAAGQWREVAAPGRAGDVVLMSMRRCGPFHHIGLALAEGVLHAWRGSSGCGGCVVLTPWARLSAVYRLVEVWRWPS